METPWEGNSAQEGNSRVKVTQVRMYTPAKRQVNSIQAVEKNNEEGSRMEFAKLSLRLSRALVCNHRGIFRTLCHGLGGSGLHLVSGLLRSVFRRALGLQGFGVENAIMPKAAIGQRL